MADRRNDTTVWHRDRRSKHPLYATWHGMMQRCSDPKWKDHKLYYDKGINVCERWANPHDGFWKFVEDMGPKPTPKHTLDRIDPDGNYAPENCRWATPYEQSHNRSDITDHPGVYKHCKSGWVIRLNVDGKQVLCTRRAKFEDAVALRKEYEIKYGLRNPD